MFLFILVASTARRCMPNVGRSDGSSLSNGLQSVALCHSSVKEASANIHKLKADPSLGACVAIQAFITTRGLTGGGDRT